MVTDRPSQQPICCQAERFQLSWKTLSAGPGGICRLRELFSHVTAWVDLLVASLSASVGSSNLTESVLIDLGKGFDSENCKLLLTKL